MAEGYISNVVCEGGCGIRMPQHWVDKGHTRLWGHKNGCPAEGESPRRRKAATRPPMTSAQSRLARSSYAGTLEMALGNLDAVLVHHGEVVNERMLVELQVARLQQRETAVSEIIDREIAVVRALASAIEPGSELRQRAFAALNEPDPIARDIDEVDHTAAEPVAA